MQPVDSCAVYTGPPITLTVAGILLGGNRPQANTASCKVAKSVKGTRARPVQSFNGLFIDMSPNAELPGARSRNSRSNEADQDRRVRD